jgi:hypothetical protein
VSAGISALLTSTEVRAEEDCWPSFAMEFFFSDADAQPGVYLDLQRIGDLPKQVTENPTIRKFISQYKDPSLMPLIIVGKQAPSSNYSLQLMPKDKSGGHLEWLQHRFSEVGLMIIGQPMWLGYLQSQCAKIKMTVN